MRKYLLSAALLAAMFGGGYALADETTGVIQSIDEGAQTVTLADGSTYHFERGLDRQTVMGGYAPGDMVTIVWSKDGDINEADGISPDFSDGVVGEIAAIDPGEHTVTLADGKTYTFRDEKRGEVDLLGFKVGDVVTIVATEDGDMPMGLAIAPHRSTDVTGKIRSVDQGANTVTLEDGRVYVFEKDSGHEIDLGGFNPGDMVKIEATDVGNYHWAHSISPDNG